MWRMILNLLPALNALLISLKLIFIFIQGAASSYPKFEYSCDDPLISTIIPHQKIIKYIFKFSFGIYYLFFNFNAY